MITTITMNPALDKTLKVEDIRYGEVNRVGKFREDLGGKGINVGRILTGFGIPTMNMAFLGKENQNEVLEYIRKDAMAIDYVAVDGYTRTNIKITETKKDITTDINEEGITVGREDYGAFMEKLDTMAKNSEFVIMSGSMAKGIPPMTYGNITRMYKKHTKIVIDADDEVLLAGLKGEPYLIKPNIHELERALDVSLRDDEDIIKAGRELISRYGVTLVLVSMGEEGSLLVTSDEAFRAGTLPVEIVSTVGAGDAMLAGFVYAMSRKKSLEVCVAFGAACASMTIAVEGYPILDIDEVYERSRRVEVYKVEED